VNDQNGQHVGTDKDYKERLGPGAKHYWHHTRQKGPLEKKKKSKKGRVGAKGKGLGGTYTGRPSRKRECKGEERWARESIRGRGLKEGHRKKMGMTFISSFASGNKKGGPMPNRKCDTGGTMEEFKKGLVGGSPIPTSSIN